MNRVTVTHNGICQSNPSLLWLPFSLPFFFGVGGVVLGSLLLLSIVWKWRSLHHSWRSLLFLPLFASLLSTGVGYLWFPEWSTEWGLLAVAVSAGWLWRIEYLLSNDSPLGIEEWLFSARLFGLGSLAYLSLALLLRIDAAWLPGVMVLSGVLVHYSRLKGQLARSQFGCPVSSPLVRMAIVKGDKIWLTDQPFTGCYVEGRESQCHAPTYRDHPLTSCVNPDETPEEALTRAFLSVGIHCDTPPRFLLKYQYTVCSNNKRTIYLYVLNLKSEAEIHALELRGYFYTPEQIEKRMQKGMFSSLFADEYDYLKKTLLKANVFPVSVNSESCN